MMQLVSLHILAPNVFQEQEKRNRLGPKVKRKHSALTPAEKKKLEFQSKIAKLNAEGNKYQKEIEMEMRKHVPFPRKRN